jgi:hypothetical protein
MKKLIPLLLILALLLAACSMGSGETAAEENSPAEVPADRTVITFNGTDVSIRGGGARDEGAYVVISAGGVYEITGVSSEKSLVVNTGDDPMDVTLILNNVQITSLAEPCIRVDQAKQFRLQLAPGSQNKLLWGTEDMLQSPDPNAAGAALYSADDMDIEGSGALTVYGYRNNGIGCKNDLDINSGTITVVAANNGIKGNDSVQIKGGTIAVNALGDGVKSSTTDKEGKGYVEITGGTLTVESMGDGVQAATELHVTGGTVSIVTRGDGLEDSSKALKGETLVRITGGTVVLETQEDGVRAVVGNVEITGGNLSILALGDGICAGEKGSGVGDIRISGGSLNIHAGKQAAKARGGFQVNGCSLIALCGSDKQAGPTGCDYLLCRVSGPQGDTVSVGDLGSIEARLSYKCLLVVAHGLTAETEVPVTNRNGTVTGVVR